VLSRIVLIAAAAVLAGCGGGDDRDAGGEPSARKDVVAGFYPLAWAAERIGRESVEVTNLTPPGAEPHDVELSARDVENVRSADFVLLLGAGFQPALEDAAEEADGRVVDVLDGLELLEGSEDGHDEEHGGEEAGHAEEGEEEHKAGVDPHVWLDPLRFAEIADRIGAELAAPAAASALASELRALHESLEEGLADCRRRELVTSHAAFAYFADRYGLEQISIAGLSPEAEPTPRRLEEVVEQVHETGATTIFFETLVSPRIAETVARETGARTAVLNPLEGLTDEEIEEGADYVSVMRDNLATLRAALECR
jgi:zinc transport system substrate-binding protein